MQMQKIIMGLQLPLVPGLLVGQCPPVENPAVPGSAVGLKGQWKNYLKRKKKRTPILIYWNNILVMLSLNVQLRDLEI